MTDPFADFLAHADSSEVAGYFETAAVGPNATGWAVSFRDPDEVLTVGPKDDLEGFSGKLEGFWKRSPRGAAIGYWGFDAFGLFEPLLRRPVLGGPFPSSELALVRRLRKVRTPPRPRRQTPPVAHVGVPRSDSLPRPRFLPSVERLRGAIRAGEAYQVVLAHRRGWDRPQDLWERAGGLRRSERYAFFFVLKFGDRFVLGASPESVLEIRGRVAHVNPIAGTRPVGGRASRRLRLDQDRKELAEHRMLVDLARNDLGRVSIPGGVRVLLREKLTRYARLEHLVSRVAGRLRPGVTALEALAATFPAGTVSGAPKIRATELLRREERTWRGPYGGAAGLMQASGDATWALTIRSCYGTRDRLYTSAGAGVVFPSHPAREYQETLTKLAQVERVMVGDTT